MALLPLILSLSGFAMASMPLQDCLAPVRRSVVDAEKSALMVSTVEELMERRSSSFSSEAFWYTGCGGMAGLG
jgi:hypothetical protein